MCTLFVYWLAHYSFAEVAGHPGIHGEFPEMALHNPQKGNLQSPLSKLWLQLIPHRDGSRYSFFSRGYLRESLSKDRVRKQLDYLLNTSVELEDARRSLDVGYFVDIICRDGKDLRTALELFAILLLMGKGHHIFDFIKSGVYDRFLPLHTWIGDESMEFALNSDSSPLTCFKRLDWGSLDQFDNFQHRVKTPYFTRGIGGRITVMELTASTILPFLERRKDQHENSGTRYFTEFGGFGEVSQVRIHSTSHEFFSDNFQYVGHPRYLPRPSTNESRFPSPKVHLP